MPDTVPDTGDTPTTKVPAVIELPFWEKHTSSKQTKNYI